MKPFNVIMWSLISLQKTDDMLCTWNHILYVIEWSLIEKF